MHPDCRNPSDQSVIVDLILRQEPDEEEEEEDNEDNGKKDEDDDRQDDGYSEWVARQSSHNLVLTHSTSNTHSKEPFALSAH